MRSDLTFLSYTVKRCCSC